MKYASGIEVSPNAESKNQSRSIMSPKQLSQPLAGSLEHIASIIPKLGRTELALLKLLVSYMPAGSLEVTKSVDFFAKELGLKKRATQYAITKLKSQGLIARSSASGLFAECVTSICTHHVVHCIKNPSTEPPVKKPSKAKKIAQPKAFGFLKDPSRFVNLKSDMQQALHSSPEYWNFIRNGFKAIGFSASLTTAVQYRRLRDGERGGPQANRGRNVRLSNIEYEASKVAQYAQEESLEATFRVDSPEHPLLLIDDLDANALDLLPQACAILETSPGNYQATLIAPRPLSNMEFLLVEDGLLDVLESGDRGAKGIRQLRRFPGSINNKPGLTSAFVTRVKHVSARLTLTTNELDKLIEIGANIRGFDEWEVKASAASEIVLTTHDTSMNAVSALQPLSERTPAGKSDQSASGRDFGKAIELIRKGWDDGRIIQQIEISAANRMKNGHPPGHPQHLVYAQGTVRRARSQYKLDASSSRLNWRWRTPITLPESSSGVLHDQQDAITKRTEESQVIA